MTRKGLPTLQPCVVEDDNFADNGEGTDNDVNSDDDDEGCPTAPGTMPALCLLKRRPAAGVPNSTAWTEQWLGLEPPRLDSGEVVSGGNKERHRVENKCRCTPKKSRKCSHG